MLVRFLLTLVFITLFAVSSNAQICYSLQFNGTNNYVRVNHRPSLNSILTADGMTLEGWIKITGFTYDYFSFLDKKDSWMLEYNRIDNQMLLVSPGASTTASFPFTPSLNVWYHIAVTYSHVTGTAKFFVNGAFTSQANVNLNFTANSDLLYIAHGPTVGHEYGQGKLDEIRIWNVLRTDMEILDNYNKSIPGSQPGLIAYYKFNDGGGVTTADATGNQNTGLLINSPAWNTDCPPLIEPLVNYSLQFDGIDDHVRISSSNSINSMLPADGFTVEAWVKMTDFSGNSHFPIIDKHNSWALEYYHGGNIFALSSAGGGTANFPFVPSLNTWTHVAVTYNKTNNVSKFYVNGLIRSELTSAVMNFSANGNPLYIGYGITGLPEYAKGKIDEVRLWNVVRSDSEIQERFNRGIPGNQPGLVAYYRFNEGGGNLTSDATPNINHGILVNSPGWTPDGSPVPVGITNTFTEIPDNYSLSQNFPNPFNPSTKIMFSIKDGGFIVLKVYDMLGKEVALLVNENLSPGNYETTFNGVNLSSGVYLYELRVMNSLSNSQEFVTVKRMILMK